MRYRSQVKVSISVTVSVSVSSLQSINQSISHSINQSINQSTQSTHFKTHGPPPSIHPSFSSTRLHTPRVSRRSHCQRPTCIPTSSAHPEYLSKLWKFWNSGVHVDITTTASWSASLTPSPWVPSTIKGPVGTRSVPVPPIRLPAGKTQPKAPLGTLGKQGLWSVEGQGRD